MKTKLLVLILFFSSSLFSDNIKSKLFEEYKAKNNSLPTEKLSLNQIAKKSNTKVLRDNSNNALSTKIDKIIKKFDSNEKLTLIFKVQTEFYPEGLLTKEKIKNQRDKIKKNIDLVLSNKFKNNQEILNSLTIFETIPYFSISLDKKNFLEILNIKGLINVELNSVSQGMLVQSLPIVQAPSVWAKGLTGAGQTIAVIDSGIKSNHEFVSGKIVSEACYSGEDNFTSTCPGGVKTLIGTGASEVGCNTIKCAHGTFVSGIAVGNEVTPSGLGSFSGVAKGASLISINTSSYDSLGGIIIHTLNDTMKGLDRVLQLSEIYNIAAVNMSIGGEFTTSIYCNNDPRKDLIDSLLSVGIPTIISSGNNYSSTGVSKPACIETAITVGSTDDSTSQYAPPLILDRISVFSNSSYQVDLLAPGNLIVSANVQAYMGGGGTSYSAPHVAGAFALLKEYDNDLSPNQILKALQQTGTPVTDSRNNVTKSRINIDDAMIYLGSLADIIEDYYVSFLARSSDTDGLNYWREQILNDGGCSKQNLQNVILGFIQNAEFSQSIPQSDYNGEVVERLYQGILKRNVDAASKTYWVNDLNNGSTASNVASAIFQSTEFDQIVANECQ